MSFEDKEISHKDTNLSVVLYDSANTNRLLDNTGVISKGNIEEKPKN